MKILIYGFGRMGLTHYSILNSLLNKSSFTFIEPNNKLRFLLKGNVSCNIKAHDNDINESFDLTMITSPPFAHTEILKKSLNRNDKKIFIEKPFGGYMNYSLNIEKNDVFIGYVLRHNPIIQWIKNNIDITQVIEVNANFLSNTLQTKPKGWRNGEYSGVLNEVGSHILDLCNYLFGLKNYRIISKKIESVISDVDDVVLLELETDLKKYNFNFNWVNKKIRKPSFSFNIKLMDNSEVFFDQQKIEFIKNNQIVKNLSVVDLASSVPFYLRGIDFTNQMIDLLGKCSVMTNVTEALLVNKIINDVKHL